MRNRLTPSKLTYMRLPIVISEAAWLQTVYIDDFLYVEVNQRLNFLLESTYREILNQPADFSASTIDYGIYRLEPHGRRQERVWMNLRLHFICKDGNPALLRIALAEETDPVTMAS
ncbi:hypothetical protein K5D34_04555 [Pseudomonas cichorii]|nr:hypothetical protein [Pseudomonas cichorii]MBX8508964.1 hypothetical protein [Pseudomonas cichorii]MBX8524527.1 hypothetical protein [Pseudomonas cichorii]